MTDSENEKSGEYWATVELSETDRHRLLASEGRRAIFDFLEERPLPIELEEMAAKLAENGIETETLERETVEQVAISLHHTHLPKMNDFGVIDYDPAAGRVEAVRTPAQL